MIKRICVLLILILASKIHAQESQYDQIKKMYENFEYEKVIQLTNDLLAQPELQDSIRINLNLMRAVSFFAKGNLDQTKNSFKNILFIRKDYTPNAQLLNPTLINTFYNVKLEYLKKLSEEEARKDSAATVSQLIYKKQISFGGAFLKNMILPGWGQLSLGKDRGLLYSLVYVANVGALLYYANDASNRQDAYQREVDNLKFDQLYSDYNKAYKIRNGLFITAAIIFLYSQIDLLLFHNEEQIEIESNKVSFQPTITTQGNINFSVHVKF